MILDSDVRSRNSEYKCYGAGVNRDSPIQISALFVQNLAGFGKGKKAKVLWGCGILEIFGCYGWNEIEEFFKPTRG